MQLNELSTKVNQIAHAWESFKSVNERRLSEIEKKGAADPLTTEQLKQLNYSLDEQRSRLNKIEATLSRPENAGVSIIEDGYKSAFLNYIRKGVEFELNRYETKSLSVSSNNDGGYLVAEALSNQIITRIAQESIMRNLASIETISTDSLDLLEDLGEFESGWATENQERKEIQTSKINKNKIYVHEMYAQPKATQKLIDDARIDIEKWIITKIADSFAKIENNSFLYGDGINKPKGIFSYESGKEFGQIEQLSTGESGRVNVDSLTDLYYSLESEYASQGKFLIHRNTLQQIRSLKCSNTGQYLWAPSLAIGSPDTLYGAPIIESSAMPVPADSSYSVVFADFKSAYRIVDRHDIRILRDPFTDKPFIKFYATKRVGGEVINSKAIKILKLS